MASMFKEAQDPALSFYAGMKPAQITEIQAKLTSVLNSREFTPKPMTPGVADKNFIDNVRSAQVALGVEKLDGKWGRITETQNIKFAQGQENVRNMAAIGAGAREHAMNLIAGAVPTPTALARASESPATAKAFNVTVRVSEVPGMEPKEVTLRSNKEYSKMSGTEQKRFNDRAVRLAYQQDSGHAPGQKQIEGELAAAVVKPIKTVKMSAD